jgi:hypothetical protein
MKKHQNPKKETEVQVFKLCSKTKNTKILKMRINKKASPRIENLT